MASRFTVGTGFALRRACRWDRSRTGLRTVVKFSADGMYREIRILKDAPEPEPPLGPLLGRVHSHLFAGLRSVCCELRLAEN